MWSYNCPELTSIFSNTTQKEASEDHEGNFKRELICGAFMESAEHAYNNMWSYIAW